MNCSKLSQKIFLSTSIILFLFSFFHLYLQSDVIQLLRNPFYDSDLLFPFSIFSGIYNPQNTDWVFSGIIPYFPDLLMGFVFWTVLRNIHLTIVVYAVFQVVLLALSLIYLSKCIYAKNRLIVPLVIIFTCVPILLLASGHLYFFYFLSWYKHMGVVILSFFSLGLLIKYIAKIQTPEKELYFSLILLFITTTIETMSDALFIVQFAAPAIFVFLVATILFPLPLRKSLIGACSIVLSISVGLSLQDLPKIWGSERVQLMSTYVNISFSQFKGNFETVFANFLNAFKNSFIFIFVWVIFVIICLLLTVKITKNILHKRAGAIIKRVFIVLLFFIAQLISTIGALVFTGSTETWYFHPVIMVPLILGWPFIFGSSPEFLHFLRRNTKMLSGILIASIIILLGLDLQNPSTEYTNLSDYYPPLVSCIDQNIGGLKLDRGIAQYWEARPITLLSKQNIVVVQTTPDMLPFRWENTSDWYNDGFEFVVIDHHPMPSFSISRDTVVKRFGEPAKTITCSDSDILIYNRPADKAFRDQFIGVDLPSLADNSNRSQIYYVGSTLPSQTGTIEGTSRTANEGSIEGYLTYGPYINLGKGKYSFNLQIEAESITQQRIGRWDVTYIINEIPATILSGEILSGDKAVNGEFEIKKDDVIVEVRTYYEGSGVLTVKSLSIKQE